MRRHSRSGDKPIKKRHSKTEKPKRRDPPKAARRYNSTDTSPEIQVARLTHELQASVARENATSEVLRIISSSPGELKPVFNAMLENAVRLCEAEFGNLFLYDGEAFHAAAVHSASQAYTVVRRRPIVLRELHPDVPMVRMTRTKSVLHIADVKTERSYERDPIFAQFVDVSGARTTLYVPMLKENELTGAFIIYRLEVRPFSDEQIALVQNFAAQVVIAIENTRLLDELRQRTADLTESLEQQTATGEILASISGSITDAQPVFDAIVRNLRWLFDTDLAMVQVVKGGMVHLAAAAHEHEFATINKLFPRPLDAETGSGRAMMLKQVVQYTPLEGNPSVPPATQRFARDLGFNAVIFAPMRRGDTVIGVIGTARREQKPFDDKQVALIKSFADQAVIAIENTRLLNELRESLEQQTATSEVLKVISTSPGDLQPVFSAILESAARLCDASFGNFYRRDDDTLRLVATYNTPVAFAEARTRSPLRLNQSNPVADMLAAKTVLHVEDLAQDERYTNQRDPTIVAGVELGGVRTFLAVPMLKDNEPIGALVVYRQEVHPFTDKQIELVQNFAAQAVIAIENARLLNELRESLEQQTDRRCAGSHQFVARRFEACIRHNS